MKIGLLTSQAFSVNTLHQLARGQDELVVITIPPAIAERAEVAGYLDFAPLCDGLGIACHALARYDFGACEDRTMLEGLGLDVLLTMGWNRLLPEPVLAAPRLGVIGSHTSPAARIAVRGCVKPARNRVVPEWRHRSPGPARVPSGKIFFSYRAGQAGNCRRQSRAAVL